MSSRSESNHANAHRKSLTKLRGRTPVLGALQTIPGRAMTELALSAGFDFVMLDCEKGVVDIDAHLASLEAVLESDDAFAAVRVKPGDFDAVCRYVEFGAHLIVLPDVQTAADATAFVAAAARGKLKGASRETDAPDLGAELPEQTADHLPLLFAMIESVKGVAAIADIAATPGLAGLIVGPNDLAADLGCPGDFTTKAYEDAVQIVELTAERHGLLLGSREHPGFPLRRLVEAGHCCILASIDVLALRDGYRADLAAAKAGIG